MKLKRTWICSYYIPNIYPLKFFFRSSFFLLVGLLFLYFSYTLDNTFYTMKKKVILKVHYVLRVFLHSVKF